MQIPVKLHGRVYLSTTLGIVVFTTIVFGGLTVPVLKYLGLQDPPDGERSTGQSHASAAAYEGINFDDNSSDTHMNPVSTSPLPSPDSLGSDGNYEKHSPMSPTHKNLISPSPQNGRPSLSGFLRKFDEEYMMIHFSTPVS
jgi:hypothetical protein